MKWIYLWAKFFKNIIEILFLTIFGLLVCFGLYFIFRYIKTIYDSNRYDEYVERYYSENSWMNTYSNTDTSNIIKIEQLDGFNMFYFYNFHNDIADFESIQHFFQNEFVKNDQYKPHERFDFFWNTPNNTIEFDDKYTLYQKNMGLYKIEILRHTPTSFLYLNIIEMPQLNKENRQIDYMLDNSFTSDIKVKTSENHFNFIFWTQAEDFMDKELPNRIGKKVSFYNGNKKIAEFDYSSGKGYTLNMADRH